VVAIGPKDWHERVGRNLPDNVVVAAHDGTDMVFASFASAQKHDGATSDR
jgi:hypothetical protein